MGEKETMDGGALERTRTGNLVSMDDKEGTVQRETGGDGPGDAAAKSVQWEPHKAPGLDLPEQERSTGDAGSSPPRDELKTRHDTVKNSIGNIR